MFLADLSKAFGTVCFKDGIRELFHLDFSKPFLIWLSKYLSDRQHYVQIDVRKSPSNLVLGLELLKCQPYGRCNLTYIYIAHLPDILRPGNHHILQVYHQVRSFQYADDITFCTSCDVSSIRCH